MSMGSRARLSLVADSPGFVSLLRRGGARLERFDPVAPWLLRVAVKRFCTRASRRPWTSSTSRSCQSVSRVVHLL